MRGRQMTDLEYTTMNRTDITKIDRNRFFKPKAPGPLTRRVLETAGTFEAVRVPVPIGTDPHRLAKSLRSRIYATAKYAGLGKTVHAVLSADKQSVQLWLD